TRCPAAPFCEAVKCTFCSANLFNPECWPVSAILGIMTLLYFLITGCYVFLYVPLVVGKPIRILGKVLWYLLRCGLRNIRGGNTRRFRRRTLAEIIVVVMMVCQGQQACQMVDVFNHYSTICTRSTKEITHVDRMRKYSANTTLWLQPNVPQQWHTLKFTLSSVVLPPLPILSTQFITNSARTAIWKSGARAALQCIDYTNAQNLTCPVFEDCVCMPAETKANCMCRDFPIGLWFNTLENQLPKTLSMLTFRQEENKVSARLFSMIMAEVILSFQDALVTEILVDDDLCKWYKTLLIAIAGLLVLLTLTYLTLSNWGAKIALWILLLLPRSLAALAKAGIRCIFSAKRNKRHRKQH
ncbi:hypothetical protein OSTOST_14476, partial [Ostertagia ostertagi]